jgi:CBS domain-containing protein
MISGVYTMNIMFFLTPKSEVTYIYDRCTVRQGIERLRTRGFSAIPVIDREGHYVGTITEGDFLRHILEVEGSLKSMEHEIVGNLPRKDRFEAVTIDTDIEDLIKVSMRQNFVPVVDDKQVFIGIVTRKDIIDFCYKKLQGHQTLSSDESNEAEHA